MFSSSNLLAVALAGVAAMIVGALWYSPLLFAPAWIKALGKTPEEMGNPKIAIANAAVMNLISAFTLCAVFQGLSVTTVTDAIVTAEALALGLVVSNQLMRDRFHGASAQLSLINGANTIVVFLVMALVLVFVR